MKIAIFGRSINEVTFPYIRNMFRHMEAQKFDVLIFEDFHKFLHEHQVIEGGFKTFSFTEELHGTDFIFSVGGDGTLLETATYVRDLEIPILGINAGRLGFLANIPQENILHALECLANKNFRYDNRILLELSSNKDLFGEVNYGLNEFTIFKRDTSSMIVVHTYIDGEFLNSYWADGLILSTPTGSTGYSLSCGGPLVMPQTNNFILSPVNPHNLNVRPIVVSDRCEISFRIEGRSKSFLVSLDSRSKAVDASVKMSVKKSDFKVKLVELKDSNYFKTLRNKLNWGLDIRN